MGRQRLRPLPPLRPPPRLTPITGTTVNMLGLRTVLPVSHPLPGAHVARGPLTPSPITDTDMVLDTTDTDTWASLDTPDMLPLLLPGAPKVFVAKGPLMPNLIMEVMEVTVMEVTVMVMVMVTVMAVVMVIMVKPFLAEPNHGMGIIYLIIHAYYFLTLLKKKGLSKISHILAAQKKYHNNATLFTN